MSDISAPISPSRRAAKPLEFIGGLPVYKSGDAPGHLRSRSQLERGLRLRPGAPVCWVKPFGHPDERCLLFDPADATEIPFRSAGDAWAWRARRTCPRCGRVREHLTHGRPCSACRRADRQRAADLAARTCNECRRIGAKPYPQVLEGWYAVRLCRSCTAARKRKLNELLNEAVSCPGGCGKRTAVKTRVLEWALANHRRVASFTRRYCEPCGDTHRIEQERLDAEREAAWEKRRAEQAERERLEREARAREVAELEAWAAGVLADPDSVFLDTETTGLMDDARVLDIAVVTVGGRVLLDTLVNPGAPIPTESTRIHGITDAMVAGAPTFAEVLAKLAEAVGGKRVLVYNLGFDRDRLRHELGLLGVDTARWLSAARWEDCMEPYSDWVGEWSEWHGNYRWQPLGGDHGARGDCFAAIGRVREMASRSEGLEAA